MIIKMEKRAEYYINQNVTECCNKNYSKPLLIVNKLSEFDSEESKQIVRDNLGITEKLEILKRLLDNKVIQIGGVPWDNEPTEGNYDHIISSDSLLKYLLKTYYTKEQIEDKIQSLWDLLKNYLVTDLTLDSELSTLSEHAVQNKVITNKINTLQPKLQSGINIKTINGQSILGEGNIEISGGGDYVTESELSEHLNNYITQNDLSNYLTMEDLVNFMNPLKVTASISPSLSEFTGNNINVTINISVKKGDRNINPDLLEIVLPDSSIQQLSNLQYSTVVNHKGVSTFTIRCQYGTESSSTQTSTNQVLPTYIGVDSENPNISNMTKKILSGINTQETLTNSISGNYFWIISPYIVNKISTDTGGTFTVAYSLIKTENGFNYYRSVDQLDISTITYYIR